MAESRDGRPWTLDETLIAFRLYCRLPFGKLHKTNPQIVRLARLLGRTPSSVGMKACNFASLDPAHQARGVKGLANRSRLEETVWARFQQDSEAVATEAEAAYARLATAGDATEPDDAPIPSQEALLVPPEGPTEVERTVRARLVQGFFRRAVLVSYDRRCALTGLAMHKLLVASHIIPWCDAPHRRADPTNGLCLNALHDRAFDKGLITFDENLRLMVSPEVSNEPTIGEFAALLVETAGRRLREAARFAADPDALAYHRRVIFRG